MLWRRCTLDCQGCHVDPSGAGPRNQWGTYYTHSELPLIRFFQPEDPLTDQSRFDLHYDGRRIVRRLADGTERSFPMSSEVSLRVRPFVRYLHLTYQSLLLGRIDDALLRTDEEDHRRRIDRYAVMIDELPLNTYIRAGRGSPVYGLRRPNHSLWIRERIGLDQFSTVDAIEMGLTPNVPFMRASYISGQPFVEDPELEQKGLSAHGGLRGVTLGWHVNGSYWSTQSELASIDMQAVGAGLNAFSLIAYGERNWRDVKLTDETSTTPPRLHPSSTIDEVTLAYAGLRGITIGTTWEQLQDESQRNIRRSLFTDLHPFPFLQLEIWRRFETGGRRVVDTLAVAHLYADF